MSSAEAPGSGPRTTQREREEEDDPQDSEEVVDESNVERRSESHDREEVSTDSSDSEEISSLDSSESESVEDSSEGNDLMRAVLRRSLLTSRGDTLLLPQENEDVVGEGVSFNPSVTADHAYLGEARDVGRFTFFETGEIVKLPLFVVQGAQLLPGMILPLVVAPRGARALFEDMIAVLERGCPCPFTAPGAFIVCPVDLREPQQISSTMALVAELQTYSRSMEENVLCIRSFVRQRVRLLHVETHDALYWPDSTNGNAGTVSTYLTVSARVLKDAEEPMIPRDLYNPRWRRRWISSDAPSSALAFSGDIQSPTNQNQKNEVGPPGNLEMRSCRKFERANAIRCSGCNPKASPAAFSPWIWALRDCEALKERAQELWLRRHVAQVTQSNGPELLSRSRLSPAGFAMWLANALYMDLAVRKELLRCESVAEMLWKEIKVLERQESTIRCAVCSSQVSHEKHVFGMTADGPMSTFSNPGGIIHELLTVRAAWAVMDEGTPTDAFTWFPGYAWTVLYCWRCYNHLGWRFTAMQPTLLPRTFVGLRRAALSVPRSDAEEGSSVVEDVSTLLTA